MDRLQLQHEVEQLLYREAYHLDMRQWDEWLALFTEDVVFWMPAWVNEEELATDPLLHLSLLYAGDRGGLDDRVYRIRTGDSYASTPLPRTCHVLGNVLVLDWRAEPLPVSASWTVHQFSYGKGPRVHGGRYEYKLRREGEAIRIAAKKVIFLNDGMDIPLDIYNI